MVRYPHEPTDKQIERWYKRMSPKQKAQLDKDVEEFKQYLAEYEASLPKAKVIKLTPQSGEKTE